jgi:ligand-binding SRPBCC domain-containing protein
LIEAGEEVEWKARHFGLWFKMRVRITAFRPPGYFQDSMVKGPFCFFMHDHTFETEDSSTLMADRIRFRSPARWAGFLLDRLVVPRHLLRFLQDRNAQLKIAAETDAWRRYLPDHGH